MKPPKKARAHLAVRPRAVSPAPLDVGDRATEGARQSDGSGRNDRRIRGNSTAAIAESATPRVASPSSAVVLAVGALAGGLLGWAYWPTLVKLVALWEKEPDYSHGYLVPFIAAAMLWQRRATFPGFFSRPAWIGLLIVGVAVALRIAGAYFFVHFADCWSMLVWLLGLVWLVGGWRLARWSLVGIAFLGFMLPLPYRIELGLTVPLQAVATQFSVAILQTLGMPAIQEGATIILQDSHYEVAEACSGLRIFLSVLAVGYAYCALARCHVLGKAILIASLLPIALISNSVRIAATAALNQYASSEAAKTFSHDMAGWVMLPFAAGLMALVLVWSSRLIIEHEEISKRELLNRATVRPA